MILSRKIVSVPVQVSAGSRFFPETESIRAVNFRPAFADSRPSSGIPSWYMPRLFNKQAAFSFHAAETRLGTGALRQDPYVFPQRLLL